MVPSLNIMTEFYDHIIGTPVKIIRYTPIAVIIIFANISYIKSYRYHHQNILRTNHHSRCYRSYYAQKYPRWFQLIWSSKISQYLWHYQCNHLEKYSNQYQNFQCNHLTWYYMNSCRNHLEIYSKYFENPVVTIHNLFKNFIDFQL